MTESADSKVCCKACGTEMNSHFKKCPACSTYNNYWGRIFFSIKVISAILTIGAAFALINKFASNSKPLGDQLDIKYEGSPLKLSVDNHSDADATLKSITLQVLLQLTRESKVKSEDRSDLSLQMRKFDIKLIEPNQTGIQYPIGDFRANQSRIITLFPDIDLPESNLGLRAVHNKLSEDIGSEFKIETPVNIRVSEKNIRSVYDFCEVLESKTRVPVEVPKERPFSIPFVCTINLEFENEANNERLLVDCNEEGVVFGTHMLYQAFDICEKINTIRSELSEP